MKKIRFLAFLCALAMLAGLVPAASAVSAGGAKLSMRQALQSNTFGHVEGDYYILKNNKTVKFMVQADYQSSLMTTKGKNYSDVIFDTEKKVYAYTPASWVHIVEKGSGFILWYDANDTRKVRTATISIVDGEGYVAVIRLRQFGRNQITSAVRNKKTLTLKYKLANATNGGYLYINKYKIEDGEQNAKTYTQAISGTSGTVQIKLNAGWTYSIALGAYYKVSSTATTTNSTDTITFTTTSENVKGKETLR